MRRFLHRSRDSIRTRTLVTILIMTIFMAMVMVALNAWTINGEIWREEEDNIYEALDESSAFLDRESSLVEMVASNPSILSGLNVEAAGDPHLTYLASTQASFSREYPGINILAFFDDQANPIAVSSALDFPQSERLAPQSLAAVVKEHPNLLQGAGQKGYLALSDGRILIVAIRPVDFLTQGGAFRGALVVGNSLDANLLTEASRQSSATFEAYTLDHTRAFPEGQWIERDGASYVIGYRVITDLTGRQIILRATQVRTDYLEAIREITWDSIAILLIGLTFAGLSLVQLEWRVLSPITRLSQAITRIGVRADPSERLAIQGADEISRLGATVNQMLDQFEVADEQRRQVDLQYRDLIELFPDAVLVLQDQHILFANQAAARLLGERDAAALIGHPLPDYFQLTSGAWVDENLGHCATSAKPITMAERKFDLWDGRCVDVVVSIFGVTFNDHPAYELILRDLTAQKQIDEETRKEDHYRATLNQVNLMATASLDFYQTMQMLANSLADLIQADNAFITLWDVERGEMIPGAAMGELQTIFKDFHPEPGERSMTQSVIEAGHVLAVEDALDSPYISASILARFPIRALLGVPLIADGKTLGAALIGYEQPHRFTDQEVARMEQAAGAIALAIAKGRLNEDLREAHRNLAEAYDATIEGWARALELRDHETYGHSDRVTNASLVLAQQLGIQDEAELAQIRRGALLHDIGKMGIPDEILLKPGPLTPEEWTVMRKHPEYAYQLLLPISFLHQAMEIPYCHHERWDGSGYPRGLRGEEIPLSARIFAVADVWDALSNKRPYHEAWPLEKILAYLEEQSGKHFDPQVVEVFIQMWQVELV